MYYKLPFKQLLLASLMVLASFQANAGVVITGTRVIYPAGQKEVTVKLNNNGTQPALMQAWIDTGSVTSTPTSSKAPFLLSPPVARIDPAKGQSLRVMFTGAALAPGKESIFWLNVLEIPPKPEAGADLNTLQMAFRSRIKLFYRPTGLPGTATEAIEQVQWQVVSTPDGVGLALQAFNPSAFYVSMVELDLVQGATRARSEDGMVAPGETRQFPLPTLKTRPAADAQVEFSAINDYGALIPTRKALKP
ncbi:fimbria/pilus periplasmic chaperone [Pseudomonas sp. TH32]|uniref:fimbrial biogenesis chaperone n=1 Tax=Pseudomonas sp. TH32 TaxID=2796397 RepID=UPI0019126429|nr:fimbria/pilus periplasmic chaperone [Pseudomonas sp. TH32]MBK5435290.1 fimbria/pilus periplasmic chaperone [Pseudomonas sp. TH32]MBK5435978.1 fimbria/pilus periplasmic chaperone [Pseudomonas sp. TH32]MBK5435991.1 fimbria/pilus periplasmic chaperone [Pseudomonas sp. TH32]MBK5441439.1 fimbria/pilus periplasmic chaperone [Pseudomonas sp. TH32]